MTIEQRREKYWKLYTAAEGLLDTKPVSIKDKPRTRYSKIFHMMAPGLCYLGEQMNIDIWKLKELVDQMPKRDLPIKELSQFWFLPGDWKKRQKVLINAIKATYDTD